MKKFMDENFLLSNETAVRLYHDYAKDMPIIDYHCHLNPQEIYENKKYKNITEVWLGGDHYKWRQMRSNGIDESCVTGNASDYDKFLSYCKTLPVAIGNPLYHWSHLELQRFFDVYDIINEENAPAIWEKVNAKLNSEGFGARDLIKKSNVKMIGTTDDPVDTLEWHIKLKEDKSFDVAVLPSFRPDKGLNINRPTFLPWVKKLAEVSGQTITNYDQFLSAFESRVRFFASVGCAASDHAMDYVPYAEVTKEQAAAIFAKALKGEQVSVEEENQYKTYTYVFLAKLYKEMGWAMQLHINAQRDNNEQMFKKLGPDTGFDSINDSPTAYPLAKLLSAMQANDGMPKTILYSLNSKDHQVLATLMGCFQGDGIPGKIQLGSAWWFLDTKEGMIQQMKTLGDLGLLGRFIGMLTDSRSFLSYTRHEYFRRIMCNLIGEWVENGEFPADMKLLGSIVQGISYNNAKAYFKF